MCSNPVNFDGQLVKCRFCEQCLEARINDWIARACGEASVTQHTHSITLTYRPNPDGTDPLGARQFNYSDVQRFFYRLRKSAKGTTIRYMVCGEQGSKGTQRIHYHVILFSALDLTGLGEWTDLRGNRHKVAPLETMALWSMWDHGHVKVQRPGQRGISYALKYVLKDQFSSTKSRDHFRETKSQPFAASKFMMSKKPPIGLPFLKAKLDEYEEAGNVPASLRFTNHVYRGYYLPQGLLREYTLLRCHKIITDLASQGRVPAALDSLLQSLELSDPYAPNKDMETLFHGQIEALPPVGLDHHQQTAEYAALKRDIHNRQHKTAAVYQAREITRQCGGLRACEACEASISSDQLPEYQAALFSEASRRYQAGEGPFPVNYQGQLFFPYGKTPGQKSGREAFGPQPGRHIPAKGCLLQTTPRVQSAFRHSNATITDKSGNPLHPASGRNAPATGQRRHRRSNGNKEE